jgi:Na+/H+ antiporter NhaB
MLSRNRKLLENTFPTPFRRHSMRDASLPITLIVVGLGWLLWEYRLFPDVDWIISLGFIVSGIAVLAIDRINKSSVVVGPFLIVTGIVWFMHDRYGTSWRLIVPVMLVFLGVLMLVARNPRVPERRSGASPAK